LKKAQSVLKRRAGGNVRSNHEAAVDSGARERVARHEMECANSNTSKQPPTKETHQRKRIQRQPRRTIVTDRDEGGRGQVEGSYPALGGKKTSVKARPCRKKGKKNRKDTDNLETVSAKKKKVTNNDSTGEEKPFQKNKSTSTMDG